MIFKESKIAGASPPVLLLGQSEAGAETFL